MTACAVLGSILVELCIRAGISCAEWIPTTNDTSEATQIFLNEITKTGFSLQEPEEKNFTVINRHYPRVGPVPPKFE